MNCNDIVLYQLASIEKDKCKGFKIIESKVVLEAGSGIEFDEVCKGKFVISANVSGGTLITNKTYENNITAAASGNTALFAIMFGPNTVNKIILNIAATRVLPSLVRESSWKEYKASYSFFGSIVELGSFASIDMGDFDIVLSVLPSSNQLIFYVVGSGFVTQISAIMKVESAVFSV
jgi:hypothetical protein